MEPTNENNDNGPVKIISNHLSKIQEVLLGGINEAAVILQKSVSTAPNATQKYEELIQSAEEKVGQLEAQLQEKEESLRAKESAIRQLEENLSSLLEKHNSDTILLKSETEAKVGQLEAQLQEREGSISSLENTIEEQEETLPSKFQELELRLTEKENLLSLLENRNAEITNLRSQIDGFQVFDLSTEVSFQLAERGLCLTETLLPFLEMSQLNNIGSKLDALVNTFEDIVNCRKGDTNAEKEETAPE